MATTKATIYCCFFIVSVINKKTNASRCQIAGYLICYLSFFSDCADLANPFQGSLPAAKRLKMFLSRIIANL